MSADIEAAARAYGAFYETLTPESVAQLHGLVAADVRFKDPFNDVRGVDRMIAVLQQMFEDATDIRFELGEQVVRADLCFVRWRFWFRPRRLSRGELWHIEGVSAVRFDHDSKVIEHIDYWDAAEHIYQRLPVLGPILRWVRQRLGARSA
jgi:steroid Delta-isomerase